MMVAEIPVKIPDSELESPVQPILDDDPHEAVWEEIDKTIDAATSEIMLKLATIVGIPNGPIRVHFDKETAGKGVGFAHTMGTRYFPGQRVVVAPIEGGDFVILGAITAAVGTHERVIGQDDLMDDAILNRHIGAAQIGNAEIAPGAVNRDSIFQPSITRGHIFGSEVLSNHIANDQIEQRHLVNQAVGSDELANDAVRSQHMSQNARNLFPTSQDVNAKADKDHGHNEYANKDHDHGDVIKQGDLDKLETKIKKWVTDNFKKK